ncbi:uncharacterized protein B0H18DRAFT_119889 [Fomitopsis serialis]|uniref:uncharacterized protein n=1 Tax=Fomitopsis serialis TaxID=139415 RepID=UPI0020085C60|nr:uncharacterized protein B0H18DRAFT_119889 [Neoantrodia serialis]KAH9930957.1 hypothetical protein B0H18DRAFT_119889 [Neoantrodia serialis]
MLPPRFPLSLRAQRILLAIVLFSLLVSAGQVNRTIDDTYGDLVTGLLPTYTSNWNPGQGCSGCAVQPSKSEAYAGTWHDTTSNNPNSTSGHYVTIQFTGTAIWMSCILVNNATTGITIFTNVSIELDSREAGTYTHVPDPTAAQYVYNVTVFGQTGLSNNSHTLVMTAVQGSQPSLLLFDRAIYT